MAKRKLLFCFLLTVTLVLKAEASVTRFFTGNRADVNPKLFGPVHVFGGGGSDVESAIQWVIDSVRGCTDCQTKVDVVVLRASGADGYNDFIFAMKGVDSVETLLITDRKDSEEKAVIDTIKQAEIIFFAGGDQCNYVRHFKDTQVESAIKDVYKKGGGIGGTSAGLAIQSPFAYDGCSGSVSSNEALSNPYHSQISFTYDFFNWKNLSNTISDTHFAARNRMGRLISFIARQIKEKRAKRVLGFGVNERTSLVVDKNGVGR